MKVHCLGATREVGRSAFVVQTDKRMLLDYGIKINNETNIPQFPLEPDPNLDLAIISHAHLDHTGFVPHLASSKLPWYSTTPTREISEVLWNDSLKIMGEKMPYNKTDIRHALENWKNLNYGNYKMFGETSVTTYDAGHILGSTMLKLEHEKKSLVYTGDFKSESTRMHAGAKPIENVNAVMIDSTYSLKEHPERRKAELELIDNITEAIDNGGTALLPAFAVGRSQELVSIIRAHIKDVPLYLDGMGRTISQMYIHHRKLLNDGRQFSNDYQTVNVIEGSRDRERATRNPGIIITSAGMMNGGPVLGYLKNLNNNSKIILTGYSIEGTNAWKLMNKGYVSIGDFDLEVTLPVDYIDFSAHASRTDILNFIKWANPEKIIVIHSDVAKQFETELREDFGYDAVAPKAGDRIDI